MKDKPKSGMSKKPAKPMKKDDMAKKMPAKQKGKKDCY
jgi:hypothetical protein